MAIKSSMKITESGKIRAALADALVRASKGELSAIDGKNMIGLANQITLSISVELKHQNMESALGMEVTTFGKLNIGG